MARSLRKSKGRRDQRSFVQFPHHMLRHPRFHQLSGWACKLLLYLASQYRGTNNGDLQATTRLATGAGWTSKASLAKALQELEIAGFIVKARQGGRNRCSLYALTWFAVDECGGKLDIPASRVASNDWNRGEISTPRTGQSAPRVGQSSGRKVRTRQDCPTGGVVRVLTQEGLPHGWGPS